MTIEIKAHGKNQQLKIEATDYFINITIIKRIPLYETDKVVSDEYVDKPETISIDPDLAKQLLLGLQKIFY